MSSNASTEFAKYLSTKNYLTADSAINYSSENLPGAEFNLRKLWTLTDLSANDFADEVAGYYGLQRCSLADLMSLSPLTARFSPRFLRETTIFPYQTAKRGNGLAVADPSDVAAVRAAEIVLGKPLDIAVASFEDIATVLTQRLGEGETARADGANGAAVA